MLIVDMLTARPSAHCSLYMAPLHRTVTSVWCRRVSTVCTWHQARVLPLTGAASAAHLMVGGTTGTTGTTGMHNQAELLPRSPALSLAEPRRHPPVPRSHWSRVTAAQAEGAPPLNSSFYLSPMPIASLKVFSRFLRTFLTNQQDKPEC